MKSIVDVVTSLKTFLISKEAKTRAELGAHNLFNLDIAQVKSLNTSGSWTGNVYEDTTHNLTYTINSDMSVNVTSSGVTTTGVAFILGTFDLKAGSYTLNGSPEGSSQSTFYLQLYKQGVIDKKASASGLTFDVDNDISNVALRLIVESGTNIGDKTFYPMIRLSTDPLSDYTTFAMTNRELTQNEFIPLNFDYSAQTLDIATNITIPSNSTLSNVTSVLAYTFTEEKIGMLYGNVLFATNNTSGVRYFLIRLLRSTDYIDFCQLAEPATGQLTGAYQICSFNIPVHVKAGDRVVCYASQNSGSDLTASANFYFRGKTL